jgi:hypothetical protein
VKQCSMPSDCGQPSLQTYPKARSCARRGGGGGPWRQAAENRPWELVNVFHWSEGGGGGGGGGGGWALRRPVLCVSGLSMFSNVCMAAYVPEREQRT